MNVKSKLLRFFYSYFGSFGASALIFSVAGYFNETFYRFLLPSAIALVLPAAINALVLCRRPQTFAELWLGRALYGLALVLCTLLSYFAFGLYKSWEIVLLAGAVMVGLYALWGIPLFILADRREKRNLHTMNEVLKDNKEA
jgi:hypothetical protein